MLVKSVNTTNKLLAKSSNFLNVSLLPKLTLKASQVFFNLLTRYSTVSAYLEN
nr:MAG TPA: hypothetical protein [Caudoviricetes sp.]